MEKYNSIKTLFENVKSSEKKLYDYVIDDQALSLNTTREAIIEKMNKTYLAMCESLKDAFSEKSNLKIEQNDGALKYKSYVDSGKSLVGKEFGLIIARAMAIAELNASMGRIVASPTAGSCGILPACLLSIKDIYNISDEQIVNELFTASAIGMVFANVSSIAGATGGCQAECGVAQAMAAATIVELCDGSFEQIENAIAISIKNIEGLVCDPVAGLVECPCIKRNAAGAMNAILAADLALAGVKSIIPVDEVILAMKQVGDIMDTRLKETAQGGLATTLTGISLKEKVL